MRREKTFCKLGLVSLFCWGLLIEAPALSASSDRAAAAEVPDFVNRLEGFGAATKGSEGGPTFEVTSLSPTGPGSIADAVDKARAAGKGIIEFRVRGKISTGMMLDGMANLTIHGNGCELDKTVNMRKGAHDIILRDIAIRHAGGDGISIHQGSYNIVIDHCSLADFGDGSIDITDGCHDVTVQWCILADNGKSLLWGRGANNQANSTNHAPPLSGLHRPVADAPTSLCPGRRSQ